MRRYIADQIDGLDASVFSGDMLEQDDERQTLKEHCERWLRAIAAHESLAPGGRRMTNEHLFIGGPRDGERFTVLYGGNTCVFDDNGVLHTYRRARLADTRGMTHDVFICDGEPVNVVEMLIKNYRKEEK